MSTSSEHKSTNRYILPCIIRSKMHDSTRGFCFLMLFMILIPVLLPVMSQIDSTNSLKNIQLSNMDIFFLFLAVMDVVAWLYIDVFHGLYIFMDKNGIRIKSFMQPERRIPWEQIGMVDMMCNEGPPRAKRPVRAAPGRATYVRLTLRATGTKNRILHRYPKTYCIGKDVFSSLDLYRFINTVGAEMETAAKRTKMN